MMQETDLQKAINRLKKAIDDMEQQAAWEEFQRLCGILAGIVPGFVCPFDGVPGIPSLEQMAVYAVQWEQEYWNSQPPPEAA